MAGPETNALREMLRFESERGEIWLKDYRMVLLSACALGALRQELVESLGWDRARGLMKRFGYAAGLADGVALAQRFPELAGDRQMELGPALHALEGIARVSRIPELTEVDLEAGKYHVEAFWEGSFEAEQHLELMGPSQEPVCWTLVGYAAGHSAAASEKPTVVVETECRAMGHDRCRFTAVFAEEQPELAKREAADYAQESLPDMLQGLRRALRQEKRSSRSKEKALEQLRSEVEKIRPRGRFVGESQALAAALDTAQAVAPYDATALVLGESGTGKELLARFIHEQSPRREQPFVAVNCSALPENLQEAELFGFAKGAFTGASSASAGVFEAASEGTLFLDEIGDLAPSAQTKILRALQEGEIKRLGESRTRQVRPRIVAATHRDLEEMVRERSFREDLFYRLSVVSISLPPLRDRGNDILLLAEHFLRIYGERFSKEVRRLSREASLALMAHGWPGNVRELENVVQRAVILAKGPEVEIDDLPPSLLQPLSRPRPAEPRLPAAALPELGVVAEEERIRRALELTGGNRNRAAELLGVHRTTLWRRMKALGLDAVRGS